MNFKQTLKKLLFIFLFFGVGCQNNEQTAYWPSLASLYRDRLATEMIKKKRNEEAFSLYLKNLEENSLVPSIHSNIAVLLEENQKSEDAAKSFLTAKLLADQQKQQTLQFATRFNLGVYFGQKKKYMDALDYYQMALEINPSSKETKHNIELLIQQQQKDQQKNDKQDNDQKQDQNQDQQKDPSQGQSDQEDKNKNKDKNKDGKDNKDQNNQDQQNEDKNKQMQSSPKYKPRPYQGEQLSEGDVKKILGELKNQEQKIRANFDKKERKDKRNEKDW